MYGPPKTKEQLAEELGMKGKQLTDALRREVSGGRMVRRMVFRDPIAGNRRHAVWQSVPQNLELELSTAETALSPAYTNEGSAP